MRAAGWSPSVRLFEAAACGVPIVSDAWAGLEDVLEPGREILVAHDTRDVLGFLDGTSETERMRIAAAARDRVCTGHSGDARAAQLESYVAEVGAPGVAPIGSARAAAERAASERAAVR
jgi:spore maturation protein CgeB